jgi:hypothetical protein
MMKRVLKGELGLIKFKSKGATYGGDIMGGCGSNAPHYIHIRYVVAAENIGAASGVEP